MHDREDKITGIIKAHHQLKECFNTFVEVWERSLKENPWLELTLREVGDTSFSLTMFDGGYVDISFSYGLGVDDEPFGKIVFSEITGGILNQIWTLYFDNLGNLKEELASRNSNSIHNLNHFYRFSEVVFAFLDKYLDRLRESKKHRDKFS